MMRPVDKMQAPVPSAFGHHNQARGELIKRLGRYCSYCERAVKSSLAVEHIQPKSLNPAAVADTWVNYLLSCANCNSCKLATNISPADVFLPDRDNTFKAFDLNPNGTLRVHSALAGSGAALAQATLDLFKLGARVGKVTDLNGDLVENDRIDDRMDALKQATLARATWDENPSVAQQDSIVFSAKNCGFFSMWMRAFEDVPAIRQEFIKAFAGTEATCFDPVTSLPISTDRPAVSGLVGSGKI
ncbi:MAG: HNH endonuclease [Flavobacteriales bacterium]|nr:HNH endonuclease [Flavobacteriales bacterium]